MIRLHAEAKCDNSVHVMMFMCIKAEWNHNGLQPLMFNSQNQELLIMDSMPDYCFYNFAHSAKIIE